MSPHDRRRRLGDAVRAAREGAGLSLRALAQLIDIPTRILQRIERGAPSSVTTLIAIADALGVRPSEIMMAADDRRYLPPLAEHVWAPPWTEPCG